MSNKILDAVPVGIHPGMDRDGAIALVESWLRDESGYDEATWPQIKAALAEPADDWQARALAAESERDASSLEYAKYRQEAAAERDTLRTQLVAAEADVARLLVAVRVARRGEWDATLSEAVAAIPMPPAAVAALVRAARAVTDALGECDERLLDRPRVADDRSTYAYQYGFLEAVICRLRALLDTPPWRDLR